MDDDVQYVMDWCHTIKAQVHIRGTDERPIIVITDRFGRELGGSEVRRRMERALNHHD